MKSKFNFMHNPKLTNTARMLRKNMTKEEKHLWYDFLSGYPVRFAKQYVIDEYIVDFYCHKARLVIELDGSQHYESQKSVLYDKQRTAHLKERGILVLRFQNSEINRKNSFKYVCDYIHSIVCERCPEAFEGSEFDNFSSPRSADG